MNVGEHAICFQMLIERMSLSIGNQIRIHVQYWSSFEEGIADRPIYTNRRAMQVAGSDLFFQLTYGLGSKYRSDDRPSRRIRWF